MTNKEIATALFTQGTDGSQNKDLIAYKPMLLLIIERALEIGEARANQEQSKNEQSMNRERTERKSDFCDTVKKR